MKAVVFYETADDFTTKAPVHFPAHKARLDDFHSRGLLLMVGAFADPVRDGSMGIFTSREAAEDFVKDDPFVHNEVVRGYAIKDWNEILV